MTTQQRLMDYYNQWSRINKANDELLSNRWIINETSDDTWTNNAYVLAYYTEIPRSEMINKLTYIINADKEYDVLTKLQISSIYYCLDVLKERTELQILTINTRENMMSIGTFKQNFGFVLI